MTDRWKRLVPPVAGVLLVALCVVGVAMGQTPDTGSSGAKVLSFYESHKGRATASVVLFAYAAVVAVMFYAGMASYLRRRGSDVLATVTVVGGALMAVGLGLGAGSTASLIQKTSKLTPAAAQALNQVSEGIFFITLFGGLALATLAMGISMLRTRAMPKALGIVTVVVGIGAFTGIGSWFAFMASAPLTLVIAGYLYARTGASEPAPVVPSVPAARVSPDDASTRSSAEA